MGSFKIDFDIDRYGKNGSGILPNISDYLKHDFVINADHFDKGNVDHCVWKRYVPSKKEAESPIYKSRELMRVVKTGAWIFIKDELVWLPPSYYFGLQYGGTGGEDMEFRLKRLKIKYFKLEARKNPGCKGTFVVKNRQDGETTDSMIDSLWECADGADMYVGQIGLQSKTRADAINPCWATVQQIWQGLDPWVKDALYSDFVSGDNIAEKLLFMRSAQGDIRARHIRFQFYPAVYNAMDGKNNMKKCILDEVLKWVECNFMDALINYSKFIMPGFERRGMFDIFSSPADKDCQSYRDGYELWKLSDTNKIDPATGTTQSRIHRYYSNPLEGIQGAYDKWGDADPQQIYDHIMRERKAVSKDKLLGEIRGYPLDEAEMWGSVEGSSVWSNNEGIKARKIYIIGRRFKDDKTQEPCRIYGNLEHEGGYVDADVQFRASDLDRFDLKEARFCFSYLPQNKEPLKDIRVPPKYIENCLGVDPFNHRYPAKHVGRQSNGAMVNRKFRDLHETGIINVPTMIYCCRPQHQDTFHQDVIRAAIFNRALIQYENRNDKLENYAEDNGFSKWLLPTIGAPESSKRKGDAPSGKGKFLDEGMALLDAATNTPATSGEIYRLLYYWFPELLDDYLKFNPLDTHENDLTMADIQSLIGCVKIMYRKMHQPSEVNDAVFDYLFG